MTVLYGELHGGRMAQHRRGLSRDLRTLARAVARYGFHNLAARSIAALRSGGPALLLHKFRQQRSLTHFQPLPELRVGSPAPPDARLSAAGDGFVLGEDFSLPIDEFSRFANLWPEHPAIKGLIDGRVGPAFDHAVVVAPHPEHGFGRLHDTLDFAGHLARRTGHAVRVAVYAPGDEPSIEHPAHAGDLASVAVVRSTGELRQLLGSSGVCLVQFWSAGTGYVRCLPRCSPTPASAIPISS